MAIVIESVTETAGSVSSTSSKLQVVFNMPATRPDNDLYIACIGLDDEDYTSPIATGWTERFFQSFTNTGSATTSVHTRVGSSEPSTYTFEFPHDDNVAENANIAVIRVSGHNTTDEYGASSSVNQSASAGSSTATAPAITAEEGGSVIFRQYIADTASINSFSAGTEQARMTAGSGWAALGVTTEASPGASTSTGTETASLSASDQWAGLTFEILAAAAAAPFLPYYNKRPNVLLRM